MTFAANLFEGKTLFAAGATSGINLGIANTFARLGAKVFVLSRSAEKVESAVATLRETGAQADGAAADVRDYAMVKAAVDRCAERFGPIDFVLSGAAGNFVSRAADLSSNGFRTVIDIDLVGSFHVCRAAYEHMRKPGAVVINISATQSFTPMEGQVHVCAAKAGIDAMARVLAIEWGPEGVRVNTIAPGPVEGTEGMRRLTPSEAQRKMLADGIPLRRYATIQEIADTAVFLCSPAGGYMNGEVVVCDGGQSLLGGKSFSDLWAA